MTLPQVCQNLRDYFAIETRKPRINSNSSLNFQWPPFFLSSFICFFDSFPKKQKHKIEQAKNILKRSFFRSFSVFFILATVFLVRENLK